MQERAADWLATAARSGGNITASFASSAPHGLWEKMSLDSSSRGGRDFETIIRSLTDIGYGMVWSVLDAQYFGVAQRRRRVFLVGHLGGEPRPEVLALGEGAFGHPPPSRTPRQEVAGSLAPGSQSGGPRSTDLDGHGAYVVEPETGQGADLKARETEISPSLTEADGKLHERGVRIVGPEVASPITATYGKGPSDGGEGRQVIAVEASRRDAVRIQDEEVSNTLQAFAGTGGNNTPMVVAANQRDEVRDLGDLAVSLDAHPGMKQQTFITDEVAGVDGYNQTEYEGVHHPLRTATGDGDPTVRTGEVIRRLTPLECERLQGFPDGWTDIEGNPDTQRYRQLGNAVAVPVAEWILRRLADA